MHQKVRVVIADGHPMFRTGLRHTIESDRRYAVIGEAGDAKTALNLSKLHRPDVLIFDAELEELSKMEISLQKLRPDLRIVVVTDRRDESALERALNAGADCHLTKESASSDVLACLRAIAEGKNFTSAEVTTYMLRRERTRRAFSSGQMGTLTKTERSVLALVAQHKTNREIGDALCISHRTVENHRTSICSKLDLRGPHALLKYALAHKRDL